MRWLNSNMGCMETFGRCGKEDSSKRLNSNMGCMETKYMDIAFADLSDVEQ